MSAPKRTMGQGYTREKREALLAEPRFGILSISRENMGPIACPVWHRWDAQTGELRLTTGHKSRKGRAMLQSGRATYTVMDDHGGYVTLEGPVQCDEEFDHELELVATGVRYMGEEAGEAYVRSNYFIDGKPLPGIVLWRITPEHWLSVDLAAS